MVIAGSQSGSTRTVPTDAQTQSQTMSQTAPRTPSKLDITTEDTGGEDGDASPADDDTGWGHWFAMWFPLIKIMEVQARTQEGLKCLSVNLMMD